MNSVIIVNNFLLPSVVIEEIIEDDKPSKGNANGRRLKKHDLDDSDDAADGSQGKHLVKRNSSVILESEDEDGFPICFSSKRKNVVMDSERCGGVDYFSYVIFILSFPL